MTIKELFDKAENGVLSYDQFMAAAGTAKFADLSEGAYVSKSKYDAEITQRDGQITTLNGNLTTRDADLAKLQKQLEDVGADSEKLATLTANMATLQRKYDTDTKNYQKQLDKQAYEFAVREYSGTQKFTSGAAKREFERAMIDKGLQMENGKIMGADDFTSLYRTDNADSFKVDEPAPAPQPAQQQNSLPQFVQPSGNPQGAGGNSNPFQFNFTGVHARPTNK